MEIRLGAEFRAEELNLSGDIMSNVIEKVSEIISKWMRYRC